MTSQELLDKIKEDTKTKPLTYVTGAFGDTDWEHGVVEEVLTPEEGGVFMKLYGCDYLLPGFPEKNAIEVFGLPKAMFSAIPREIVFKSWLLMFSLGFLFLLRRRKFIHILNVYLMTIQANALSKTNIPEKKYNHVSREIHRAVYVVIQRRNPSDLLGRDLSYGRENREVAEVIAKLTEFICLLIELDSAYRLPIQDTFGDLDKEQFLKNVSKGIKEVLGKMESRWTPESLKEKPRMFKKVIPMVLFLSPTFLFWFEDIIKEIDFDKIKMDENDWYFCLARKGYDYSGLSFEERLSIRKKLDEEKGTVRLKFSANDKGQLQISA